MKGINSPACLAGISMKAGSLGRGIKKNPASLESDDTHHHLLRRDKGEKDEKKNRKTK